MFDDAPPKVLTVERLAFDDLPLTALEKGGVLSTPAGRHIKKAWSTVALSVRSGPRGG